MENWKLSITETKPTITEKDLDGFEKEVLGGLKLPDDYIQHLLQYNGGRYEYVLADESDWTTVFFPAVSLLDKEEASEHSRGSIAFFNAIYDGPYSNLKREYRNYRSIFPPTMLPIAYDPGGNQICLSLAGQDYGYVYYWIIDEYTFEEIQEKGYAFEGLFLAARSFTEFLANLYPYIAPPTA